MSLALAGLAAIAIIAVVIIAKNRRREPASDDAVPPPPPPPLPRVIVPRRSVNWDTPEESFRPERAAHYGAHDANDVDDADGMSDDEAPYDAPGRKPSEGMLRRGGAPPPHINIVR